MVHGLCISSSKKVTQIQKNNSGLFPSFPVGSVVKNPPAMQETLVQSLSQEDPLEEEMATHSNSLSGKILLWTEEPGGLWSVGLQSWTRVSD